VLRRTLIPLVADVAVRLTGRLAAAFKGICGEFYARVTRDGPGGHTIRRGADEPRGCTSRICRWRTGQGALVVCRGGLRGDLAIGGNRSNEDGHYQRCPTFGHARSFRQDAEAQHDWGVRFAGSICRQCEILDPQDILPGRMPDGARQPARPSSADGRFTPDAPSSRWSPAGCSHRRRSRSRRPPGLSIAKSEDAVNAVATQHSPAQREQSAVSGSSATSALPPLQRACRRQ
jgi:hypothetical protein